MFLFSFSRWNDNLSYTIISVTKLDDIRVSIYLEAIEFASIDLECFEILEITLSLS